MHNKKNNSKNMVTIFLSFCFILLILLTAFNHSSGEYSKIGLLSIACLMVLGSFIFITSLLKKSLLLKKEMPLYIFSILFIYIYIVSIFIDFKYSAIFMAIQVTVVILFFWGMVFFPYENFNYKIGYYFILFFFYFLFISWGISGFNFGYSAIMNNPNTFGAFISLILVVFIMFKNNCSTNNFLFITGILIGLLLIFVSNSRSVWLLILSAYLVYLIWPLLIKNKKIYVLFFMFFSVFLTTITVVYPKLLYTPLGYELQNLSRSFTGKNFFSGRQELWLSIINDIANKPIFGYGAATRPSNLLDTALSAHNYYLQMTLQVGLLGTIIFFFFLYSIWNYFYIARKNKTIRIIAAIFIGNLAYQLFEVSFTQNTLAVAILQWFIFGMGINITRKFLLINKCADENC